jgi:hypothetical protein
MARRLTLKQHLEDAELRVQRAQRHLGRQREAVAALERAGQDAAKATRYLGILDLNLIKRRIAEAQADFRTRSKEAQSSLGPGKGGDWSWSRRPSSIGGSCCSRSARARLSPRSARSTATWCTFLVLALPLAVLAWLVRRPPRGLNIK